MEGGRLPEAGNNRRRFRLCNTTRYGDLLKQHVTQARDELSGVMALDTHLDKVQGEVERDYWVKRGWHAQFAPGQYDDGILEEKQCTVAAGSSSRTRGGAMMLMRSHLRVDDLQRHLEAVGTEDLTAMAWHLRGELVMMIGGYLRPSIGSKGPI